MNHYEAERFAKDLIRKATVDGYEPVSMEVAIINAISDVEREAYGKGRAAFTIANNRRLLAGALLTPPLLALVVWGLYGLGTEAVAAMLDTITRYAARIVGGLVIVAGLAWVSVILSSYVLQAAGHWRAVLGYAARRARGRE